MNYIKQVKELVRESHEPLTRDELLNDSYIIIDNNCLVFPLKDNQNGKSILDGFAKFGKSVYIPFVTQQEYLDNWKKIVQDTHKRLGDYEKAIKKIKKGSFVNLRECISKQKEKIPNPYTDDYKEFNEELEKFEKDLSEKLRSSVEDINQLYSEVIKSFDWKDFGKEQYGEYIKEIKKIMENWLETVTLGDVYNANQLSMYETLIERRYEAKISPGYMDRNKEGDFINLITHAVNRSYSDAIFWLDSLEYFTKLKTSDSKYLVILSNEKKEDWVEGEKADKLKEDMIIECYYQTGLIPRKIDIWKFMELMNTASKESIAYSKKIFGEKEYSLYGQVYSYDTQREMMEQIFTLIFPKVVGENFNHLPCITEFSEEKKLNNNFNSKIILEDSLGKKYIIGTSFDLKQKLDYIFRLLDGRVKGSAAQLKFYDADTQKKWKKRCQRKIE